VKIPFEPYFIALLIMLMTSNVRALEPAEGMVVMKSAHPAAVTLDRMAVLMKSKGIQVIARVNHDENARSVGMSLRPTELLIFGNPKLGSKLFSSAQTAGIDLPMKALAWQDEAGQTWLAYNDPGYIAKRHGIGDQDEVVNKMSSALKRFATMAAEKP